MSRVRGLLYSFGLVFGAIGSFLVLIPWCLLLPMNRVPKVAVFRRAYLGMVTQMFFSFAAVMIEYVCGTRIYIHGTDCRLLDDKGVLVLANHRTRVDWMYGGWSYATLLNNYPQLAFILKRSLKDVPFFGWCMQIMMYIFLERKREQDLPKIDKVLRYLKSHDLNSSLFIFPEGTDLSESNIVKNTTFAEANNLPPLKYVLYPKPTGFITCLNIFKQFHKVVDSPATSGASAKLLDEAGPFVHNITIAYKDFKYGKRTTDGSIVKGEFPTEIHMLVQRISLSAIPSETPAATAEWLRGVFLEKEKQLKSFYEHPSVVNNGVVGSSANIDLWPAVVFVSSSIPLWKRLLQMTVMPLCTILCLVLFHQNRWYRYAVILFSVLFVASPLFNGFDNLELAMTDNQKLIENQQRLQQAHHSVKSSAD